jgi:glycosyltransferase involved in cell wall biosynthesis
MAGSILYLFENTLDRIRIEDAARKKVEREYGWDVIARQQADLYRELGRQG